MKQIAVSFLLILAMAPRLSAQEYAYELLSERWSNSRLKDFDASIFSSLESISTVKLKPVVLTSDCDPDRDPDCDGQNTIAIEETNTTGQQLGLKFFPLTAAQSAAVFQRLPELYLFLKRAERGSRQGASLEDITLVQQAMKASYLEVTLSETLRFLSARSLPEKCRRLEDLGLHLSKYDRFSSSLPSDSNYRQADGLLEKIRTVLSTQLNERLACKLSRQRSTTQIETEAKAALIKALEEKVAEQSSTIVTGMEASLNSIRAKEEEAKRLDIDLKKFNELLEGIRNVTANLRLVKDDRFDVQNRIRAFTEPDPKNPDDFQRIVTIREIATNGPELLVRSKQKVQGFQGDSVAILRAAEEQLGPLDPSCRDLKIRDFSSYSASSSGSTQTHPTVLAFQTCTNNLSNLISRLTKAPEGKQKIRQNVAGDLIKVSCQVAKKRRPSGPFACEI